MNRPSEERQRSARPTRKRKRGKLGMRDVLTAPKIPGYVTRFVNDVKGRVKQLEDRDWEVVIAGKEGSIQVGDPKAGKESQVGTPVRTAVGGGVEAVLMKIPEEYFEEDKEAKAAEIRETEKSMMVSDKKGNQGDGQYGEVKIKRKDS